VLSDLLLEILMPCIKGTISLAALKLKSRVIARVVCDSPRHDRQRRSLDLILPDGLNDP